MINMKNNYFIGKRTDKNEIITNFINNVFLTHKQLLSHF